MAFVAGVPKPRPNVKREEVSSIKDSTENVETLAQMFNTFPGVIRAIKDGTYSRATRKPKAVPVPDAPQLESIMHTIFDAKHSAIVKIRAQIAAIHAKANEDAKELQQQVNNIEMDADYIAARNYLKEVDMRKAKAPLVGA